MNISNKKELQMLQLLGTYYNGKVILDDIISTSKPVKVVITFQEEVENEDKSLKLSDFSFFEAQEFLKEYKGTFSEEVVEERRAAF